MPTKISKNYISLRVSADLLSAARNEARRMGVSVSSLVRLSIEDRLSVDIPYSVLSRRIAALMDALLVDVGDQADALILRYSDFKQRALRGDLAAAADAALIALACGRRWVIPPLEALEAALLFATRANERGGTEDHARLARVLAICADRDRALGREASAVFTEAEIIALVEAGAAKGDMNAEKILSAVVAGFSAAACEIAASDQGRV